VASEVVKRIFLTIVSKMADIRKAISSGVIFQVLLLVGD